MTALDQNYLQSLIENRVEESTELEYKAAAALENTDKKKGDISKDISAMANSAGGKVIYGITEKPKPNNHIPDRIDIVERSQISKEWLEQVIQSRISPMIEGITIHPIIIDGDDTKVVYLVEIPQSTTAHQASDRRYYKRHNFNSIPMEDYEVRDTMNRSKNPIIDLEFQVIHHTSSTKNIFNRGVIVRTEELSKPLHKFILKVCARNIGTIYANYIIAHISIPINCLKGFDTTSGSGKEKVFTAVNTIKEILDQDYSELVPKSYYAPTRYDPLLPSLSAELNIDIPELANYYYDPENELKWTVYADNATPRKGSLKLSEINKIKTFD